MQMKASLRGFDREICGSNGQTSTNLLKFKENPRDEEQADLKPCSP